jgi:hypothetical protein
MNQKKNINNFSGKLDRRRFINGIGLLGLGILVSKSQATTIAATNNHQLSASQDTLKPVKDKPLIPYEKQKKIGVVTRSRPNQRSKEEIEAAYSEMQPVEYLPVSDRWLNLPITFSKLTTADSSLSVVMLGDSIINDTYRSQWETIVLQPAYPNCEINAVAVVGGGAGCSYYKQGDNIEKYVLPWSPDLLIIGGISQGDIDSIRIVINMVRTARDCDVLLLTKTFGGVRADYTAKGADPYLDYKEGIAEKGWTYDIPNDPQDYRRQLFDLAIETKSGFLDMTAHWGSYIRKSKKPLDWYKRDWVHANIRGEQIIGRILAAHLSPVII